jgi:regulatory protein
LEEEKMPLYKISDTGEPGKKKAVRINKTFQVEASEPSLKQEDEQVKRKRKKLADMTVEEQVDAAKETILNILSMVAKSRKQLFDRLLEKGYSAEIANQALDRLAEVGIVDDVSFANLWASTRHSSSGLAPYAIKRELTLKGIDEDIVMDALSVFDDEALEARALEIAISKAKTARGERNAKIKKVASAVARKGYNSSVAFKVAKQALEMLGEDVEDVTEDSA